MQAESPAERFDFNAQLMSLGNSEDSDGMGHRPSAGQSPEYRRQRCRVACPVLVQDQREQAGVPTVEHVLRGEFHRDHQRMKLP
jgi:hypothetical protein